jgi:hypothetical protein
VRTTESTERTCSRSSGRRVGVGVTACALSESKIRCFRAACHQVEERLVRRWVPDATRD